MDNATGLAAVLAVARALAPLCHELERGLRVMFFTVEEWALAGSRHYVEGLDGAQRDAIACVLNLDSVAGHTQLTALTSGYPALGDFLTATARSAGLMLATHEPIMANSDHYNFAVNGIPAARLVAGFDEPDSNLRYVLTPQDTLERCTVEEMNNAVAMTTVLAFNACQTRSLDLRRGARVTA
jgi:Zn-dependent M28 family amino/carboxypeptidase